MPAATVRDVDIVSDIANFSLVALFVEFQKCSQRSCFALMVVMSEPIETEFDSFQVQNHSMIAYMARNSRCVLHGDLVSDYGFLSVRSILDNLRRNSHH